MPKIPRLNQEQRNDLVAYLDGELDESATQEIEHVLAHSPVARNEVEMLTRTWELLDVLPRAQAGADFTERTLTTIKAVEYRQPLSERPWYQKARRGAILTGWVVGLVASAVVGFLVTFRWIPNEADLLVRELPVIERLDVYTEVGDIEFLKELRKHGIFDDDLKRTE